MTNAHRVADDLDNNVPFEWDGRTRYSDHGEPRFAYERRCLSCGRTSPTEWITHARARCLGLAGVGKCSVCHGVLYMDPVTVGALNSPLQTVKGGTTISHG
jgi:hypothetical protein